MRNACIKCNLVKKAVLSTLKLRIGMNFTNLIVNTLIYSGGVDCTFHVLMGLVETIVETGEDTSLIL